MVYKLGVICIKPKCHIKQEVKLTNNINWNFTQTQTHKPNHQQSICYKFYAHKTISCTNEVTTTSFQLIQIQYNFTTHCNLLLSIARKNRKLLHYIHTIQMCYAISIKQPTLWNFMSAKTISTWMHDQILVLCKYMYIQLNFGHVNHIKIFFSLNIIWNADATDYNIIMKFLWQAWVRVFGIKAICSRQFVWNLDDRLLIRQASFCWISLHYVTNH